MSWLSDYILRSKTQPSTPTPLSFADWDSWGFGFSSANRVDAAFRGE